MSGVDGHDVAVVLGSGWRPAVDLMGDVVADVASTDLPGFPPSTVAGHAGSDPVDRGARAAAGCSPSWAGSTATRATQPTAVAHAVRTAHAAGCAAVVLTNAAGGITEGLAVGQPVLIADHLNLTGGSPVAGPMPAEGVPSASSTSPRPTRPGCGRSPARSTPRSSRACTPGSRARTSRPRPRSACCGSLGADLVGMSTVWETIAARHLGLEVLALSLVTNLAAGLTGEPLDHDEVLEAGRAAAERMGALLADVVGRM